VKNVGGQTPYVCEKQFLCLLHRVYFVHNSIQKLKIKYRYTKTQTVSPSERLLFLCMKSGVNLGACQHSGGMPPLPFSYECHCTYFFSPKLKVPRSLHSDDTLLLHFFPLHISRLVSRSDRVERKIYGQISALYSAMAQERSTMMEGK